MPGLVSVRRGKRAPTLPPDADFGICVIGATSTSPLAAGKVSAPYGSTAAIASDYGVGDAVDAAMQAVARTNANAAPMGVCLYRTPSTTPGSYGSVDTSGVTGTAVITASSGVTPLGTYQPRGKVVVGGILGIDGVQIDWSLDEGRKLSGPTQLHTSLTFTYPNSEAGWTFAPSTTNAAYVALAVELRADALAHMANVTAHDGADTNAGQVALAASSVPATVTASTAVVNLVRTALLAHFRNITTVHDGPDLVNVITLGAATNAQTGIDLAIHLKAKLNAHEAAALAAGAAGALHAATATTVAVQTLTAASMLSGAVAALDLNPRRLVLATAGGTAADAPANVAISGFDLDDAAQTETLSLAQTAASVTSVKAWKGTGLSLVYAAGDGTGATIAVSYSNGVHNSADSTNTISAADPTYGTLLAGDVFSTRTVPPMFAAADIYDAGDPNNIVGAFAAIAECSQPFGLLVITEPIVDADYDGVASTGNVFTTLVAGLDYLATFNKRPTLIVRFRDPLPGGETDAAYIAAVRAFCAAHQDSRIHLLADGVGWVTDAATARRYLRSGLAPRLARLQSFRTLPEEKLAHSPACAADGPLEGFSIVDDAGHLIAGAHDEFIRGGIDGPVGAVGGASTCCYQRDEETKGTYVSRAPVLHAADDSVITLMDARVSSGIERELYSEAWLQLQGAAIVKTTTLDPDAKIATERAMRARILTKFANEIANPGDPNLVDVDPTVVVDPTTGEVTMHVDVNDELFRYVGGVDIVVKNLRS